LADLREQLEPGLRGSYAIERELGRGGMATVFLAQDLKHKRPVALKVLLPELAASLGAERFHREIEIAARLQHPHILTVLDSGEVAGQLWFTMPYVEGQSLRDRLRRDQQLPVEDALRITREAAAALDYAHEHGVVHRDIKPENILLTRRGEVLVADFGIARALGAADSLTQTGLAMGTPAYMSPEQAAGGAVDGRSDIYSLGCVLYEMLAGEAPYTGPTPQAIVAKRFVDPVPSVRRVRPTVPEGADLALQRALARVPADRFGTAFEFAQALQQIVTTPTAMPTVATPMPTAAGSATGMPGVAAPPGRRRMPVAAITLGLGFVLGLGVLFAWRRTHVGPAETTGPKVLAVLPFENLGDSAEAYFADGVTDEVRTKLSQLPGMEVIARGSSNLYRHTNKSPQEIARELGADYLLTATVRWEKQAGGASRVRVIPELVDAGPGHAPRTRWGQQFDASLTDVFKVQAQIAGDVAQALDVALGDSARKQMAARPTQNLEAYDAFLRGEQLIITEGKTDIVSARLAAAAYREAVQRDPGFALAWARLARANALRYNLGDLGDSVLQGARGAADRALLLAPDRAESHYAIGFIKSNIDGDPHGAVDALERAWRLAPHDPDILSMLGSVLDGVGRTDEAVTRYGEAAKLDPRSVLVARRYASVLLNQRRFAEADSVASAGLRIAPDNSDLVAHVLSSRLARGDVAGARTALREALQHVEPSRFIAAQPGFVWLSDSVQALALRLPLPAYAEDRAVALSGRALVRWNAGRYDAARADADSARGLFATRVARHPDDLFAHYGLAISAAGAGRKSEARAEAERVRTMYRPDPGTTGWTNWIYLLVQIDLGLGNTAGAVAWLDTLAHLPGPTTRAWLKLDPLYAPLRSDPAFQRLVAGN
jgi:TolB-like protein/predicted Ser/Thr protein kinase